MEDAFPPFPTEMLPQALKLLAESGPEGEKSFFGFEEGWVYVWRRGRCQLPELTGDKIFAGEFVDEPVEGDFMAGETTGGVVVGDKAADGGELEEERFPVGVSGFEGGGSIAASEGEDGVVPAGVGFYEV